MARVGGSRAQSQVIGAVLIFAFIIAALGAAQVVLVPQANEEVEFKHNQEAQQDMQDLRGAIQRSAVVGASQSESVDLSAAYPTRFLLLNPGEGAGTIRTAGGGSLTIDNAKATDKETEDFWDGSSVTAPSQRLIYSPSYNYYDGAPETVYENSVLYNNFSDTDIAESDQDIVDGRRIYLTALEGEKSTSKSGAASIDVRSVSPATETIAVRNESNSPLQVTIPTKLSEEVWVQDLLDEEIDDPGGGQPGPESGDRCDDLSGNDENDNDRFIVNCRYDDSDTPNELTLTFQNKTSNGDLITYSLKMSKVGVGTGITTPDAKYITDLKGNNAGVPLDGRQEVIFQVRNKYNNPVDNATVDVQIESESPDNGKLLYQGDNVGSQAEDNISVGPDGEVKLTYVAPTSIETKSIDVDVNATFGDGPAGPDSGKNATVSMQVINASRIDRTQPLFNPPSGVKLEDSRIVKSSCSNNENCEVNITFASDSDRTITSMRYTFYSSDGQGKAPSETHPEMDLVDENGNVIETFEIRGEFKDENVDISIPNSDDSDSNEGRVRVRFYQFTQNGQSTTREPAAVNPGDYFVISLVIDGQERNTYFVAPEGDN